MAAVAFVFVAVGGGGGLVGGLHEEVQGAALGADGAAGEGHALVQDGEGGVGRGVIDGSG